LDDLLNSRAKVEELEDEAGWSDLKILRGLEKCGVSGFELE